MSRFKQLPLVAALALTMGVNGSAFAAENTASNTPDTDTLIKQINERTAALENQVKSLKSQLAHIKLSKKKESVQRKEEIKDFLSERDRRLRTARILMLGAMPVVSSPYIGVRSYYDASDLITNIPSYNQDLQLLQQRQKLEGAFIQKGLPIPTHPLVLLSGKLEGQAVGVKNYNGRGTSDVNLSSAEIDFISHLNRWVTGFAAFVYDNSATTPVRTANSRIYVDKAFMTVGNLNVSPWYSTLGQRYVPFGQYQSYMLTSPLTQTLGQTKGRIISFGYQHMAPNGVYGLGYAFRGNARVNNTSNVNQYGATLGYQYTVNKVSSDVGIDGIANMADSLGMQNNVGSSSAFAAYGSSSFAGFGASSATELLVKRVPGVAVHGRLAIDNTTFFAEYLGATRAFNNADLSFNGVGAQPKALHVEGVYRFKVGRHPTFAALGYDVSRQALALGLPRQRVITAIGTSFWRDTIATLEFHRDQNYGAGNYASGRGGSSVLRPAGSYSNTLTAQFGVYF